MPIMGELEACKLMIESFNRQKLSSLIYGDKKNHHTLKKEDLHSELQSVRNDLDKIKKMTKIQEN